MHTAIIIITLLYTIIIKGIGQYLSCACVCFYDDKFCFGFIGKFVFTERSRKRERVIRRRCGDRR